MWLSVLFISSLFYIFLLTILIVFRLDHLSFRQKVSKDYVFEQSGEDKTEEPQPHLSGQKETLEEPKDELYKMVASPDGLTHHVVYNRALTDAYKKTLKG